MNKFYLNPATVIIVALSAVILYVPQELNAQENTSTTTNPISLEGRKALQFGVGSNLTLTSVDNAIFSYKWMTSENSGYRLNLNLYINYVDQDLDRFTVILSGTEIIETNNTQTDFTASTGAEFDFLKYHQIHDRLFLYTAIGPTIQFRYHNRVTDLTQESFVDDELFDTQASRVVTQNNRYGIGGSAGLGIEWFVTPNISFSGEYALRLFADYRVQSSSRKTTGTITEQDIDDTLLDVTLEGTGVRIRLSVYF